jgi:histidine triad (HIT) family protein
MNETEESVFTKIIKGDIPSHKIYEDDQVYAFLDIHPIQPGHTLVVPKQQVQYVWDLDQTTYQSLMAAVQKIARHLRDSIGTERVGMQIIGVDVPHAHIHLIPFNTLDEFQKRPDMDAAPDHQALAEIANNIKL